MMWSSRKLLSKPQRVISYLRSHNFYSKTRNMWVVSIFVVWTQHFYTEFESSLFLTSKAYTIVKRPRFTLRVTKHYKVKAIFCYQGQMCVSSHRPSAIFSGMLFHQRFHETSDCPINVFSFLVAKCSFTQIVFNMRFCYFSGWCSDHKNTSIRLKLVCRSI